MVSTVCPNSLWIFFQGILFASFKLFSKFPDSSRLHFSCCLICLCNIALACRYSMRYVTSFYLCIMLSCSIMCTKHASSVKCMSPPPTMTPWNSKQRYTMLYSIYDHHRTHTVRIREVSAWSGKYIHVGARAGWQVAPAQHSRQWILVQLSAECEPTGSVLRAEATDLECVKDASRTTLHSSQKLPSNQMARRRVAFPVRDPTIGGIRQHVTISTYFNGSPHGSSSVPIRFKSVSMSLANCHQLVTAVLYNMWQVSNTFAWARSI